MNWIYTTDKLPQDKTTCLVSTFDTFTNDTYVGVATYSKNSWTNNWGSWCEDPDVIVIAWMELPKRAISPFYYSHRVVFETSETCPRCGRNAYSRTNDDGSYIIQCDTCKTTTWYRGKPEQCIKSR